MSCHLDNVMKKVFINTFGWPFQAILHIDFTVFDRVA
jgi:hypothetical protein